MHVSNYRRLRYGIFLLLLLAPAYMAVFADGVLTVKTDPDGIEVWLDGKFLGQSPVVDKKIKAGRYQLKLVDPAQRSSTVEDLLIQDNDTIVVDRAISSKFGSLRVTSDPDGADVAISTELGKTPLTNDFMNPGRYRIEIKSADTRYHPTVTEVVIPKGETVTLHEKLKKDRFFSTKTIISLSLMTGTAGGFIWAIAEQGRYRMYSTRDDSKSKTKADASALGRTFGIILGASCLIGLEITTFF